MASYPKNRPVKTVQTILFSLMLIAIVTFAPSGLASGATPSLHSSGINVYNSNGQQVSLYGLNIMYGQGESVTLVDLQTAKASGFNAFRVNNVFWGLIQPYNQSINGIDVPFFSTGISTPLRGVHPALVPLDNMVNMAVQENMYLVICLFAWSGWYVPPQWAFSSISHAGNNAVWGGQSSASLQAYAGLISGTASKERSGLINTWKFIANRYGSIPNVMFELLNEPDVSSTSLAGTAYKAFNEDIISAIESVESQPHLKVIEFLRDNHDFDIVQGSIDLSKPNIVWAKHHYAPQDPYIPTGSYWHDSFTWRGVYFPAGFGNGTTYVAWRIIRVAAQAHGWGRPWMVTEFGKQVTKPNYNPWFKTVLTTMAEQSVAGWYYYCYSSVSTNDAGWNIRDTATRQLMMPILSPYMAPPVTTTKSTSSTTTSSTSALTTSTLTTSRFTSSGSVTTSTNPTTSSSIRSTTSSPTTSRSATSTITTSTTFTTSTSAVTSSSTSTASSTSTTQTTTTVSGRPNTVALTQIISSTQMPNQRKSCYADGRFWLFAVNGTNFNAYSSIDGNAWKIQMIKGSKGNPGEAHAIWCGSSNTFAYAYSAGGALSYRKGTLNSDGTITWATSSEQVAVPALTGVSYNDVNVAFDSLNEPWVGYYLNYASNSSRYAYVVMCTNTDGSWSAACVPSAFPVRLTAVTSGSSRFVATPVPLTAGRMIIEYVSGSDMKFRDRIYYASNRSLGPEEVPNGMTLGSVYGYSSVAKGDDVYTAINVATSYDLVVYKRTYVTGRWAPVVVIQPSTASTTDAVISIDGTTGNLYVFWAGSPTANHVYYRKFQASNATWLSRLDWITDSSLNSNDKLTSFYQASNNFIGIAYIDNTSSPYAIRFIYLSTTKQ